MEKILVPTKEVEKTNKEVMLLQETANAFAIKNPKDLEVAVEHLVRIKEAKKVITTRKEEVTRPLMQGLASVRDLFRPMEITLKNATDVLKAKVTSYQTIEEQKIEEKKARIEARVEKGTMRVDTAMKKFECVGEVTKKVGKMQTRTITKVRIVDETIIPREYMIPDMKKITEAVLRQKLEIAGVEAYKERNIAV